MSGIACALSLYNNFDVQIYEKSRGIGGRLCAKRLPQGLFHFGAQFCTAHTIAFQNFLRDSDAVNFLGSSFDVNSGSIIETKDCFVARDGMHSLLKKYNEVLNIHYNHKAIDIDEKRKLISFDSGQKVSYDIIISSLPLPQTREIFQTEINHDATFSPCLAVGMSIDGNPYYEHNAYKNINKDAAWLGILMTKAGMSNIDALKSATIETAKLLRVEDVLGQIKPGMLADIIAFQKNPIEDISTVENVSFVMKDGIVFKQTP